MRSQNAFDSFAFPAAASSPSPNRRDIPTAVSDRSCFSCRVATVISIGSLQPTSGRRRRHDSREIAEMT